MKITLHPGSAVVGAVLVAAPFVLMSFQAEVAWPRQVPIPVSVQEMPDPHDMVVIREEDGPYTVPPGKLFVLTGLGGTPQCGSAAHLSVNGVPEVKSPLSDHVVGEVPIGFTAKGGDVLTFALNQGHARAWGYLVDA